MYDVPLPGAPLMMLQGESTEVSAGSIDTVVITHVLCSVTNITQVLSEVDRCVPCTVPGIVSRNVHRLVRRGLPGRYLVVRTETCAGILMFPSVAY
jgi:hypothetical protein